jgi:hypothetical protein
MLWRHNASRRRRSRSALFELVRRLPALPAEQTRIYPNSGRLCSGLFGAEQAALDILRLQK